jgi:hypothetical protein
MYYARETAYYARIMLEENSVLIGTKTQKVVHFSFKMFGKQARSDFLGALMINTVYHLQLNYFLLLLALLQIPHRPEPYAFNFSKPFIIILVPRNLAV